MRGISFPKRGFFGDTSDHPPKHARTPGEKWEASQFNLTNSPSGHTGGEKSRCLVAQDVFFHPSVHKGLLRRYPCDQGPLLTFLFLVLFF